MRYPSGRYCCHYFYWRWFWWVEVRVDHMIPRTGLALADKVLPFLHSHTPVMAVKGKIAFIVKVQGLKDAWEMESCEKHF